MEQKKINNKRKILQWSLHYDHNEQEEIKKNTDSIRSTARRETFNALYAAMDQISIALQRSLKEFAIIIRSSL